MKPNVGNMDRAARSGLAILLLAYSLKKPGKLGTIAACNAGMLISSVISGYCPLYKIIGMDTAGEFCCQECSS
jgi:Inner membrane protein YgaP-like, transmembrane domain